MRFEFISNACGIFTSQSGLRLLTDPWLVDGVFEGSWCHCPKLTTRIKDLENVDGIYLSHIHPDHYDERTFSFAKDTPIFLLDHKTNFLIEKLKKKGYTNLVLIQDAQTMHWGDFDITLFAPFVKHNYFPENTEIGNLIDSAAVIASGGLVAFNANDNTPDQLACGQIKDRFGHIDLLMHNYNSAGPYPACFNNLTHPQKVEEHETNLVRNLEYMYANVQQMEPTYTLPFAGSYALGGRLHYKNEYLGTTTWDGCASYLNSKKQLSTQMICLRENDIFDISSGQSNRDYVPLDVAEMERYIFDELSHIVYEYETDDAPVMGLLKQDLVTARKRMTVRAKRVGITADCDVVLDISGERFPLVSVQHPKCEVICSMDLRLLRRILDRKSHWNNAEIGCHIEFTREPNHYSPDIHTMLQFLHL